MRSLHPEPDIEYPANPCEFVTQANLVGLASELDTIIRGDALQDLRDELGYRTRQRIHQQPNPADYQYHLELGGELCRLLDLDEQGARDRCRAAAKAVVFGERRADVFGAIAQVANEVRSRAAAREMARSGRTARPGRKGAAK